MLRLRGWHIFLFVAASMAVAIGWYFWTAHPKRAIASDLDETNLNATKLENGLARAGALTATIFGKETPENEEQTCHCLGRGQSQNILNFSAVDSCNKAELAKFQSWEKLSPLYRGARTVSPAEFPRACVLAALPQNECRTETRVNVLYNAYADAFSCLDLPRKDWWPWWVTSGHLELTTGIATPTQSPIDFASENPACKRLSAALAAGEAAKPLLEAWSVGLTLLQNWDDLEKSFSEVRYGHSTLTGRELVSLQTLIEGANWSDVDREVNVHENLEKLKMLVWLGSAELGVRTMTDLLANFILSREEARRSLQMADFRISSDASRSIASSDDWRHFFRLTLPKGIAGDHHTFENQSKFKELMNRRLKENTCATDSFLQF